jgi:bacitracin synthase 3
MKNENNNKISVEENDLKRIIGSNRTLKNPEGEKVNPIISYPNNRKTICQIFNEQVCKNPHKIALILGENRITYQELNEKANKLAKILNSQGVKSNSIVGIMIDRSFELVIGILGILKAGAAFLPIDPNYPIERVHYMLDDSCSEVLLSNKNFSNRIQYKGKFIDLNDIDFEKILINKRIINDNLDNLNDLAYVIYTSGTTGKPKGVMIGHNSLSNYIEFAVDRYCNDIDLQIPLYTSIAFDLTITSIFPPLASGNTILIFNETNIYETIKEVFGGSNKCIIKTTPAHLNLIKYLANINKSIRKIIVGGEGLSKDLAKKVYDLFDGNIEIINEYGPTEATVGCIVHSYNPKHNYKNNVLIGNPIINTKIYILDSDNNLCPIGVAGELCISGDGLAKGYINNINITNEKFIENPFDSSSKLYKTGDLAKWLPNGELDCLGRIDKQVKIRGYRIELEEIDYNISTFNFINDVVTIVKEINNENVICSYVVSKKEINKKRLKEFLKEKLPKYMIPTHIIQLNKLPLTLNGKLDKDQLPLPPLNEEVYIPPRNRIEKKIETIWSTALNLSRVSINDKFYDLGGNSLNILVILSEIEKDFQIEIPMSIFNYNTNIKHLSKYIINCQKTPSLEEKCYPLLLNNKNYGKVFCFPPIAGLGLVYQKLAQRISKYSIYAFDFLEDEKRIENYIESIIQTQPKGPYILMGYSAGVHLTFKVAEAMEERGYEVSDIIVFDSLPLSNSKMQFENKDMKDFEIYKTTRQHDERFMEWVQNIHSKEKFFNKVESYFKYLEDLTYEKRLNSNIHIIKASDESNENSDEKLVTSWGMHSLKYVFIYNGHGLHKNMLSDNSMVDRNARIFESILEKITLVDSNTLY